MLASKQLRLSIARLGIALDAGEVGLSMALPRCYAAFGTDEVLVGDLHLRVRSKPLSSIEGWQSLYYDKDTWQLWRDAVGSYAFVPSLDHQRRWRITVEPDYRSGEVVGERGNGARPAQTVYPLQDMDIRLYAKWLAEYGDLILHACGVEDRGAGYAFVGSAGAGKSTLASAVACSPEITVLGEDNVILRCIDSHFLLYGTPWHTDPARCSPGGVPLRKLFFLDRTGEPGVRAIGPLDGVQRVLQDSFIPYYDHPGVSRILASLGRLAGQVPFYVLSYRLGSDVLGLIREA